MPNMRNQSATVLRRSTPTEDAIFRGWQKTSSGEVFALYNVTAPGHPSLGSTVTGETLHRMNLRVPDARPPQGPIRKPGSSGK